MPQVAIKVENVWKEYRIRHQFDSQYSQTSSIKELLAAPIRLLTKRNQHPAGLSSSESFWALRDVNFEISHGESVGLIGKNGAGKSTLLKIFSRITRPTKGRVILYERVNSLLEIGTGFNAELSGRDNIYLNGSFLGMSREEIKHKFDEIVAFSDIEQFIDTPVKYYSSGMFVRLAFSVAVHLTPETLLLDEVLSVGDAEFRQKSLNKMKELINCGATIVLVSHNEDAIKDVCKRAIWLSNGSVQMDGPSEEVVNCYLGSIREQ